MTAHAQREIAADLSEDAQAAAPVRVHHERRKQPRFEYLDLSEQELVSYYCAGAVVIHDDEVVGHYATADEALADTARTHATGTFIVRETPQDVSRTTSVFRSLIAFE